MRPEVTESKYALISVHDKSKLDIIIGAFKTQHVGIIGSGGTAEAIRKMGHQVLDVSKYTGTDEMPGGLVKTLHPKIHAGILGDWNDADQRRYMEAYGIMPLDYVIVNLYPFQMAVKQDPSNLRRAVDNVDIGGVALIRAAGKGALLNHRVVPITSPDQYEPVSHELSSTGKVSDTLRWQLAQKAFAITAEYDSAIRDYLKGRSGWKS